jgi:DNA invertase Pin-like site-specific DNA recombinase
MITAVYARKSTEQHGVADEQKSVTRQIEHARAYAIRKGWTVSDDGIFIDDGISGAEFAGRPGFVRLMNALKPRPAFQVLVMSEESRLGREAIETAYALKQLVQAGVRVFFYMEDRERTLDSPTDKIMLSLTAFADELEREKARHRTYDAMIRKARAGHVTGGRVFGYDNVDVFGPDGKRSYVVRTVNEPEAAIVRRIFEWSAAGVGLTGITKRLNEAGALAPRPQQGRPAAWVSSSVRAVLRRPLYRGEILWNQTRKRDGWGRRTAVTGRLRNGSGCRSRHYRSSRRSCGRLRTARAPDAKRSMRSVAAVTDHLHTCCRDLPGARSVAAGLRRTADRTGNSACCSTLARRIGNVAPSSAATAWSAGWTPSTPRCSRRWRRTFSGRPWSSARFAWHSTP